MIVPPPSRGPASLADTGRTCPYCRFALKEGDDAATCAMCAAPHHADCWTDNRGCAVVACPGGPPAPGTGADAGPVAPAGVAAPAPSLPAAPVQQPGPAFPPVPPLPAAPVASSPSGRGAMWLSVVLIALAIAGAATAAVLLLGRDNRPAAAAASPATTTVTETTTQTAGATGSGLLPAVPESQMASDIADVLLEYHRDVVAGDLEGAWSLLSQRKRRRILGTPGKYAEWQQNMTEIGRYLDPDGLTVSIVETDPRTGVATVDVEGMNYNKSSAPCATYSGITWMLYERGAWRYDLGYGVTPQRQRKWAHRYAELLGGSCYPKR